MKTKLQSLGFTSGHMHLLLVAVAFFSVLMVAKSDINIKTLFVHADDEVNMLTYEEAHADAAREFGSSGDSTASADADAQLALLDRSLDSGQVLGDSIGIGAVPAAEEIFSLDSINKIQVQEISNATDVQIKDYADKILYIESSNDVITMLANINSGDSAVIKQSQEQATRVVQMMGMIFVPEQFAEYHRYKTLYYSSLINVADIWMKNRPETDLQTQSTLLFSVMAKVESLKASLENQYKIQL